MKNINRKKYGGKYVTTKSFTDLKVITSGINSIKVYDRAIKKGINDPVIQYIFPENVTTIF